MFYSGSLGLPCPAFVSRDPVWHFSCPLSAAAASQPLPVFDDLDISKEAQSTLCRLSLNWDLPDAFLLSSLGLQG